MEGMNRSMNGLGNGMASNGMDNGIIQAKDYLAGNRPAGLASVSLVRISAGNPEPCPQSA